MAYILIKQPRTGKDGERVITFTKFEKHYVTGEKDVHLKYGIIKKADLKKKTVMVGKETFHILPSGPLDEYKQLARDRQIVLLKDIGSIIANTGVNKNSKVLDAGVGSGALAIAMASIAREVVAYDNHESSLSTAKANQALLNVKNLTIKEGSIYEPVVEKDFDVFTLDVPEPHKAITTAQKALKRGGYLAVYSPNLEQVMTFIRALKPEVFLVERVIEVLERDWAVDEKRSRPVTKDVGHTAFLVYCRKL